MLEQKHRVIFKTEQLPKEGCTIEPDGFSRIEFHHAPAQSYTAYNVDGMPHYSNMYLSQPRVYDAGRCRIANSFKVTKHEDHQLLGFTIKKYYEPIK